MNEEKKLLTKEEKKLLTKFRGKYMRICKLCGTSRGVIRKYGLYVCRRCFREIGRKIGFKKLG